MILSIIIPVYNVENYLVECLDSVFSQNLNGCEVITINDGSTDNSREILEKYQTKYPKLIIIDQENKGLSGARNTGMRIAKGEFIYFLDSDDYLLPSAVNDIIQSIIKKSNAEVIGFNAIFNGETIYIPSFKVDNIVKTGINFFVDFYKDNGFYPYYNVWLYVYKKSFLEKNNLIFKEGFYHEDIHFTMYVFSHTQFFLGFNIPLCNYRQHRVGSICTDIKFKNIKDKSIICRELDNLYRTHNVENVYFYNAIFYTYLYAISQAISNGYNAQRKQFFCKEDIAIMKKGIIVTYEFKLWLLACVNLKLLVAYYDNTLNRYIRRLLNHTLSTITYIHCKS